MLTRSAVGMDEVLGQATKSQCRAFRLDALRRPLRGSQQSRSGSQPTGLLAQNSGGLNDFSARGRQKRHMPCWFPFGRIDCDALFSTQYLYSLSKLIGQCQTLHLPDCNIRKVALPDQLPYAHLLVETMLAPLW